jgi:hypothetical protein
MPLDHAEIVGVIALAGASFISAYYLMTRIREDAREHPDPKLTYATNKELEGTRQRIDSIQKENRADIERIRVEAKADIKALERRHLSDMGQVHNLVHRNAEHIAELIARLQMLTQRLGEIAIKTDRIHERHKGH